MAQSPWESLPCIRASPVLAHHYKAESPESLSCSPHHGQAALFTLEQGGGTAEQVARLQVEGGGHWGILQGCRMPACAQRPYKRDNMAANSHSGTP